MLRLLYNIICTPRLYEFMLLRSVVHFRIFFCVFQTTANQSVVTTPPRMAKTNHVNTMPNKTNNQLLVSTDKQVNQSQTFPRSSSNKPPPSPSRDSRMSFVTDQPKPEDFTWSAFTPISQEVFENAYTRHKYFYKFSDKVLKQGTLMKANVWDIPGKPGETMTYEQLLQGKHWPGRYSS